ncbi:hypothetical protein B0H14DRAFT_2713065 [Mycena olivaceomarginata]|nr:hypothetical protein B0H14DRAFT_2713065 [Mycena olivaceomarginata]
MSTNEPTPNRDATVPFSGVSDPNSHSRHSDFILRSTDGVDFHVHCDILKFSSDFFHDMFAIPGPGDGDPNGLRRDGKPVLLMPELEATLLRLLRLAYPGYTVAHYTLKHDDLDHCVSVFKAAEKYQFLRVQCMLEEMLDNFDIAIIDSQPHRVFAVARLCNRLELSRKAAFSSLNSPLFESAPRFPEMNLLSWEEGYNLYQFHRLCGQKAAEIAMGAMADRPNTKEWLMNEDSDQLFVWWKNSGHNSKCDDGNCGQHWKYGNVAVRTGSKAPVQWFKDHISRLAAQLRTSPSRRTAEREVSVVLSRSIPDGCPGCSKHVEADLASLARQLAKKIDELSNRLAEETFR